MLLIEKNHAGASTSTHTDNKMLYTEGHGPRGRGGGRFAMEVADGTKEEGTKVMPTTIPDPLETGGVEATRTNKGNPPRNASSVARKATERASVGRNAPIWTEPDTDPVSDKATREIGSDRTTSKDPEGSAFVTRHKANSMKKITWSEYQYY